MKKIKILVLAILTCTIGFAQEFQNEVSTYSFTKESDKDVYSIVFANPYGFTTLHHLDNVMMDNNKTMVLTKYDQEMNFVDSKSFNLPKLGGRAADLREVIEYRDKLIFISSAMHKKSKKHEVYAQVLSEDLAVGEKVVLASFPIEGYSKSGFYDIAISPDQSKIGIYASMPFVKKTKEKIKAWVYDMDLNQIWQQDATLEFDSKRAYREEAFVSNAGDIYVNKITNYYKKTRTAHLLTFNGTDTSKTTFSSAGFQPMNMKLIDVNDTPMLIGFYWYGRKPIIKINETEGLDTDGAFLYDLSAHNLIGIHEWADNIVTKDLKSLEVVDCKVIDDEIFMVGEKQLRKSEFKKNGSSMTTEMDDFYTFGSSILVQLETNGTLKLYKNLFGSKKYVNGAKEKGSIAALYLASGLRLFTNYPKVRFDSYFSEENVKYHIPYVRPYEHSSETTPHIIPNSVTAVENYNIVYYIINYGDKYWFSKMTW